MERRTFLGVAAGAAVVAVAGCGSHDDLVIVPNDWDFFAGSEYRLAVLLATGKGNGAPIPLTAPVRLRVAPQHGSYGAPLPTVVHDDGVQPQPAYALTRYRFPAAGTYTLEVTYKGQKATLPISATDPSQSTVPVVGQKLPSVATPTVATPLGVAAVCTQAPPCPLHQVSLDAALAAHRPIALLFATPAFCQSRFCGPVLQNLEAVHGPWASLVTFIHCEIYSDASGSVEVKAVSEFGLEHEPMLYLAGTDGVIVARVDNLFDKGEARSVLTAAFGASTS